MNHAELKQKIRQSFNDAAIGYDKPAMRFFSASADLLAQSMRLDGNQHILDIATGTGALATACAVRLPHGHVTGIDLSENMLAQAQAKALRLGLSNLTYKIMDMELLDFPANYFDGACCGFGVFFLPDMQAALKKVVYTVKPGACLALSSFSTGLLEPLSIQFFNDMQKYGVPAPDMSWKRLDHPDKHRDLFHSAGLERVETHEKQVGYYLSDVQQWWDVLWNTGFRGMLNQLSETDLSRFRDEHLAHIETFASEQGLWLDVRILLSVGYKQQSSP